MDDPRSESFGEERESPPRRFVSVARVLTEQFYNWERRGRGWDVWPEPVQLEPAFTPFQLKAPASRGSTKDDSRVPSLVDNLASAIRWFAGKRERGTDGLSEAHDNPEPFEEDSPIITLSLAVPRETKVAADVAELLLTGLPTAIGPVSFEVIGCRDSITVQLAVRDGDAQAVKHRVKGFFPDVVVSQCDDHLAAQWAQRGDAAFVLDVGLAREFMLPLRLLRTMDPDPLIGMAAALSQLEADESAVFQVMFQSVINDWGPSITRAVLDPDGKPFFADAPEIAPLAKIKVSRPMFATVVRIGAVSSMRERSVEIARSMFGALSVFSDPLGNELMPLSSKGYDDHAHSEDILYRRTRRSGMLLNSQELLAFVHPPSSSVRVERLSRNLRKTRAAPVIATTGTLALGLNAHDGRTTAVALSAEQRSRHLYAIGASGTGKSTLLLSMIAQDMKNGDGLAVLDPHGDLIDQVIPHVPEDRLDDVVVIDPGDTEYPIGFNILNARSDLERSLLSSDLIAVFRRLSTSWGDQMTSVLGNALLAILESDKGGTLLDLRRFLVEERFRREFLTTVKDRDVVYYWQKEFPLLHGKPQAPILTRLDQFLRPKAIRYMVAQRDDKLDFSRMMNEGKIVLARLSHGAIGEENAYLLGTLLVSRFHQVALSRQEIAEADRRPFYLYIDEFQNFVTPTMAQILSGARKYRLGLILAHQELRQLSARSPEVASAVLSNPATRICFRVGDQDARSLESGFASFDARDLQALGTGQAIARVERADYDFNLDTQPVTRTDLETAAVRRKQIITASRERYAMQRAAVEALLESNTVAPILPVADDEEVHQQPTTTKRSQATARPSVDVSFSTPPTPNVERPTPGRGGRQHKYLQELLKRWANARGWGVLIEETVLGGLGIVDVVLQKDERRIACEIAITTPVDHEIRNLQKCLAAGFELIVVLSPEAKTVKAVERRARRELPEESLQSVHFLTPEEALQFLDDVDSSSAETTSSVRGFTVKVRQKSSDQTAAKRQAVAKVIAKGLKRLRGGA